MLTLTLSQVNHLLLLWIYKLICQVCVHWTVEVFWEWWVNGTSFGLLVLIQQIVWCWLVLLVANVHSIFVDCVSRGNSYTSFGHYMLSYVGHHAASVFVEHTAWWHYILWHNVMRCSHIMRWVNVTVKGFLLASQVVNSFRCFHTWFLRTKRLKGRIITWILRSCFILSTTGSPWFKITTI